MPKTSTTPLKGQALLKKVTKLTDKNKPRREIAKECGYYTGNEGAIRVNLTDFYEALLAARGIDVSDEGTKDGRGRELTHRVSTHKNGQIVIGASYTQKMGLKPGDEFEIKLGSKHIHLTQIVENQDEDED